MIRKGNVKFVYVHQQVPLLFDLEKDPHEVTNLAEDTDYQGIVQQFEERKKDILQSQKKRHLLAKALHVGEKTDGTLAKRIRVLASVYPHLASLCYLKLEVGVLQTFSTVIKSSREGREKQWN